MTMVEAGIVAEELGAALHPGPWLSSAVAATRALTRLGATGRPLIFSAVSPTAPRSPRSVRPTRDASPPLNAMTAKAVNVTLQARSLP